MVFSLLAAVEMRSAATAASAGARVDDPLLAWAGTISGDLQRSFGDPAAGAVSATVTGGASAPFQLSLGTAERMIPATSSATFQMIGTVIKLNVIL